MSEPTKNPSAQTLARRAQNFFQVTFSDQSMAELNKLGLDQQLALVNRISSLSPDQLEDPDDSIGRFSREGKTYFRVRAGEYRCYFEITGNTLFSHYILHRNSLTDFVYRNKLPITEETMVEQNKSFWKYLETLKKPDKKS